ncbi:Imm6 family immunity protein [Pseudomonas marginalis]
MSYSENLSVLEGQMWVKRAAIFLLILDQTLDNLSSAPATYTKCSEAFELCWSWLTDRSLSPEQLAYYLDSDEMQNGPLGEHHFITESLEQDSLILILLVIGFFAHQAYKVSGRQERMSASVNEAGEQAVEYIVEYIYKVGAGGVLDVYLPKKC